MAEVFRRGDDLHTASAQAILGKTELADEERQVGKTFNFATIYGQGKYKCAKTLGISVKEAEVLLYNFHQAWPALKPFAARVERRLKNQGYLKTLWGRKLYPDSPHKAINYLVQGCAADLIRASLVKVHAALTEYDSHLVNVVHDELMLDVVRTELGAVALMVPELMNHEPINKVVPIEVDIGISETTWADKEDFDPEGWLPPHLGRDHGRRTSSPNGGVSALAEAA